MTRKIVSLLQVLLGVAALGLLGACSDPYENLGTDSVAGTGDVDIVANSYQATERLLRGLQQPLDPNKPILVATLVNVADMRQSSDLGRIVSEQVSSRLTQLGYQTKELKFRGSFLVSEGSGEFVLSRALRDISQKQDAQAVVAGVYAVARDGVYLSLRIIRADDSAAIASYDYRLPIGPDTAALLGSADNVVVY
jgi:TolB-like protein